MVLVWDQRKVKYDQTTCSVPIETKVGNTLHTITNEKDHLCSHGGPLVVIHLCTQGGDRVHNRVVLYLFNAQVRSGGTIS